MNTAIATAKMEAINTDPAAMSLMILILEFCSVEYKSHSFSIEEFKASNERTNAEIESTAIHSYFVMLK